MVPLVEFILTNIGAPVVSMIIKEYPTAHAGAWPTSEQVAQTFIDDVTKWTTQGTTWLLNNPATK